MTNLALPPLPACLDDDETLSREITLLAGKYKSVQSTDEEAIEREQGNARKLVYYQDQDGMWIIHTKLPPETGALVVKAIEVVANPVQEEKQEELKNPERGVSAETSRSALSAIAPSVDATTTVPHWRGEDCDYPMAVGALLARL
jgi:hypothetical protein